MTDYLSRPEASEYAVQAKSFCKLILETHIDRMHELEDVIEDALSLLYQSGIDDPDINKAIKRLEEVLP